MFTLITDLLFFPSNRYFAESYTEKLKNATADEIENIQYKILRTFWKPLYDMKDTEPNAKCPVIFRRKISKGEGVFSELRRIQIRNLYPTNDEADMTPDSTELFEMFEKLFDDLKTDSDHQTFAFKSDDPMDVLFDAKIVLHREFKFLTEGSDQINADTKSMLVFDQLLPYYNKHHTDENCVPDADLPLFYKKKGKR